MFREDHVEALTGDTTGWAMSHEMPFRMPTPFIWRKAIHNTALSRAELRSGDLEDPSMSRRTDLTREFLCRVKYGGTRQGAEFVDLFRQYGCTEQNDLQLRDGTRYLIALSYCGRPLDAPSGAERTSQYR